MILKEKERSVIEDLQTQEKSCVEYVPLCYFFAQNVPPFFYSA